MTEPRDDSDKESPTGQELPAAPPVPAGELPAAPPPIDDATQRRPRFGPFTPDGTGLPTSNRMPIAALVLGIASIPFGLLTGFLGIACGVVAIVVGILGIRQVRRGAATRSRFAIGGVVAGAVGVVVSVVVLIISVHHINDCKKHIGHTPSQKELTQCARDGY
jgi:hypothetical protein